MHAWSHRKAGVYVESTLVEDHGNRPFSSTIGSGRPDAFVFLHLLCIGAEHVTAVVGMTTAGAHRFINIEPPTGYLTKAIVAPPWISPS